MGFSHEGGRYYSPPQHFCRDGQCALNAWPDAAGWSMTCLMSDYCTSCALTVRELGVYSGFLKNSGSNLPFQRFFSRFCNIVTQHFVIYSVNRTTVV